MAVGHESLEVINKRLHEHYGETEERGVRLPNFRVVWSEDQFELRKTNFTPEGFQLLTPEVRKLPKYRQWIKEKWVLEGLREVPIVNQDELPAMLLTYEPFYVFEDRNGNALPPNWVVAKFVVDSMHKAMAEAGVYTKYADHNETPEELQARLKEIEDHLFGNESTVSDALAHDAGISMAGLDGRINK